jgi:mono/diheme cytochrome c family protein
MKSRTRSRWAVRRSQFAGAIVLASLAVVSGCRQDMHNQPKYRPLRSSDFFSNGSSARPLIEGTIARGTLQTDAAFFTGKNGAMFVSELPFPVTKEVLDRGQERFNIYCTPCHDATGSGNGMVVQRGFPKPPSFHIDRLRTVEAGYFFDVISTGFGRMPDYRAQVAPRDRWNIVAYIRALQLSQHAAPADVPGGDPTKLAAPAAAAPGGHGAPAEKQ